MAGFARGSRANAVIFFVSVAAATDASKNNRGCPGEIGRTGNCRDGGSRTTRDHHHSKGGRHVWTRA